MRINVANYALNDLLYALECSGVDEVACTMEDENLLIIYDSKSFTTRFLRRCSLFVLFLNKKDRQLPIFLF